MPFSFAEAETPFHHYKYLIGKVTSIPPLLPTLREHQRYVTYAVHTETPISVSEVTTAVRQNLLHFLGELHYGAAGIQFVESTEHGGIIRTTSQSVDAVKAGLLMTTNIRGKQIAVRSARVSGMIHRARSRTPSRRSTHATHR